MRRQEELPPDYFRDRAVQLLAQHEADARYLPIDVRLILKAIVNRKLVQA